MLTKEDIAHNAACFKKQERGSTKKSVLDALRSLKAKKQEQPAQEQDKPKKAKKKGMEL